MTQNSIPTAIHVANRFGLGASRADLAAIGSQPRAWLLDQLQPQAVPATLQELPATHLELARLAQVRQRNRAQRANDGNAADDAARKRRSDRQSLRRSLHRQLTTRFEHQITTDMPFRERLVQFWSNHFCVSRTKPSIRNACVGFESEVVRPHLDGSFSDLLLAATAHPTMLLYLDNAQSIGPSSRVGRRRNRGLNENLAREVLELHTLGVAGGYQQEDVTNLARILTGWTVGQPRLPGTTAGKFAFIPAMHEPGTHALMGQRFPGERNGQQQGIAALAWLAAHSATAHHVAYKLVQHFVADDPPRQDVTRIAEHFLSSDGDLPTVHAALVNLDSAWVRPAAKLRTPYDFSIATSRALELKRAPRRLIQAWQLMGQVPFAAPSPAGFPDVAAHWSAPNLLHQRLEWAVHMGRQHGQRADARRLSTAIVDARRAPELIKAVARAESPQQGLALLLAAPQMQWR